MARDRIASAQSGEGGRERVDSNSLDAIPASDTEANFPLTKLIGSVRVEAEGPIAKLALPGHNLLVLPTPHFQGDCRMAAPTHFGAVQDPYCCAACRLSTGEYAANRAGGQLDAIIEPLCVSSYLKELTAH